MLVAIGTSNPVKVKAVENVLSTFFNVTSVMKEVSSGVPPQPVGMDQTIKGAATRAKNALDGEAGAELGLGIEAGLIQVPGTISGYMDQQFAAIVNNGGRIMLGGVLRSNTQKKWLTGYSERT